MRFYCIFEQIYYLTLDNIQVPGGSVKANVPLSNIISDK